MIKNDSEYNQTQHAQQLVDSEGDCSATRGVCTQCFIKTVYKVAAGNCTTSLARELAKEYLSEHGNTGVCESLW
jgi:hypothetical protein